MIMKNTSSSNTFFESNDVVNVWFSILFFFFHKLESLNVFLIERYLKELDNLD